MLTLWGWLEPVARVLLGRPAPTRRPERKLVRKPVRKPARRPARRPARPPVTQPDARAGDVLLFQPSPAREKPAATLASPGGEGAVRAERPKAAAASSVAKQTAVERYEAIARELLQTHKIRVRKWRTSSSGIAVVVRYRDGTVTRYIESPRPKGPMSMAIFLHEIGHHVLGVGSISPRCLEEYHAWKFALEEMQRRGLNITDSVLLRVHRSLRYAAKKAQRRGIRDLPAELVPYLEPPPKRRSA